MHNPLHTEHLLLADLAQGRRDAAEKIYRQHLPALAGWIRTNGGSDMDAADIFQEAVVVLYEKSQNEAFRLTCKIGTYLFAIGKHLWYKRLQYLQKQPVFLPDNAGQEEGVDWAYEDDVLVHTERELHYEQLQSAMDQLGEPCRSLLKAFYHEDKSMAQIAADFGYTNPDNAKTQKYKCLTRLKKIFYSVQAK